MMRDLMAAALCAFGFVLVACGGSEDPPVSGTPARCGNGIIEANESCDDGNAIDGDDCLSDCTPARCGDGIVQLGVEACDDGNGDDTDACLSSCLAARCGDAFVQAGVESCDDGNDDESDGCLSSCRSLKCGDGILQPEFEECDDGNDADDDGCTSACILPRCGDGFVHIGAEECDDANDDDTDDCLSNCIRASCGDGFQQRDVEGCDDGNASDDDLCPGLCQPARCGDGFVLAGTEACDDGESNSDLAPDACRQDCSAPRCGDSVVDADEECDDGNDDETDACAACLLTFCGDGIRGVGEGCDDGNLVDGDGCSAACRVDGDGCANPASIAPSAGSFLVRGNTAAFAGGIDLGFCGRPSLLSPDAVYAFTSPIDARWDFVLTPAAGFDAALGVFHTCTQTPSPGSQLGCADSPGGPDVLSLELGAGQIVYLVVDGVDAGGAQAGEFSLAGTATPIVGAGQACGEDLGICAVDLNCHPSTGLCGANTCGDGVLGGAERCDDGNLANDDGCTPGCEFEGDTCALAWVVVPDPITHDFSIASFTDGLASNYAAACATSSGNGDRFFEYAAPAHGFLHLEVVGNGFDTLLAATSDCGVPASELDCVETGGRGDPDSLRLELTRGQVIQIVVDGYGSGNNNQGSFVLDGDFQPIIQPGGACDPTEAADICLAGHACDPVSTVCVQSICGNGILEPGGGETCDDGNRNDGDGCAANCLIEGTDCSSPLDLGALFDATSGSYIWNGDSTLLGSDYKAGCATTETKPDAVAYFIAPTAGRWAFSVDVAAHGNWNAMLYAWRGSCGERAPEAACAATLNPDQLAIELAAGEIAYLVVDGVNSSVNANAGPFTLKAWAPVCGDGIVEVGEECDDGNTLDGDTCTSRCQIPGESCGAPFDLRAVDTDPAPGRFASSRDLVQFRHDRTPSCWGQMQTGSTYRDVAYRLDGNGATDEHWTLALSNSSSTRLVLDVTSSCEERNTTVACVNEATDSTPGIVSFHLGAHETVFVFVDSTSTSATAGQLYTLTGTIRGVAALNGICDADNICAKGNECRSGVCIASSCGNLLVESGEECDDGNVLDGDGCSANCFREGDSCNAPYDLNALDTNPAPDLWEHAGSVATMTPTYQASCASSGARPDVTYRFTAAAAGTYTFTQPTSFDAVLYAATTCAPRTRNDLACEISGTDLITVNLLAGETIYVHIDGAGNANGVPPTATYSLQAALAPSTP